MAEVSVEVGPKGIIKVYAPSAEYALRAIGPGRTRILELQQKIRVGIALPTFKPGATEWAFVIGDGKPDAKEKAVNALLDMFAGITYGKMMEERKQMMEEKRRQESLVHVGPALFPQSLGGLVYYNQNK